MSRAHTLSAMLQNLEEEIQAMNFGGNPFELYEPIRYSMRMGGKRLRPLLALLSYQLFSEDWKKISRPALAVEVFHNFTLLHDDIMDKAPLRRGQATVYQKWNETVAILSGDVMLVKAYDLLLEMPSEQLPEVIRRFNRTAAEVCEGQQWDMNFETQAGVTIAEYLDMIRLKTAVLLGFSMWMGAKLSGQNEQVCEALYEVGENMGIGFQLMDDYLDVYAEKAKFGKQVGGDIIANKKTFLLLQALENSRGADAEELQSLLKEINFIPEQKVERVKAIYDRLNIPDLTQKAMDTFYGKAFQQLSSLAVPEESKELLNDFFQRLIDREK
jgi:geranylgeranyl diphosphate synthase type II